MRHLANRLLGPAVLTPRRIRMAMGVAVATDAVQLLSGPLGWAFFDEVTDVVAMSLTWGILGFHPLLLPTFVLEFVPVVDMLPTWTACVAYVIWRRKRDQSAPRPVPPIINI